MTTPRDTTAPATNGAKAETRQPQERTWFMSQASELLARSIQLRETLENVARLAVPILADWCIVDVLAPGELDRPVRRPRIERVAVAAGDPEKQAALEELRRRYPPTWDSPQPAAQALRLGQLVFFRSFTDESLAQTVRDKEHLRLLRTLAPRSAIAMPLVARGRTLGALTLAYAESDRHYLPDDLLDAEELAHRCALAVDNARLYQEAQDHAARLQALNTALRETAEARDAALAAAEAARERLAFLVQASEQLANSLDYEATLTTVAHLAVPRLADWCALDLAAEDGVIRRLAVAHVDPAKVALARELARRYPPDPHAPRGVPAVLRSGQPELYEEIPDEMLVASAIHVSNRPSKVPGAMPCSVSTWSDQVTTPLDTFQSQMPMRAAFSARRSRVSLSASAARARTCSVTSTPWTRIPSMRPSAPRYGWYTKSKIASSRVPSPCRSNRTGRATPTNGSPVW
jgi:GAF domain-containing protein